MTQQRKTVLPGASRPLLFAHRGISAHAPENTIAAFALAATTGITGVELDIQQCASGELVVFHDWTLERITGVELRVTEASFMELREFDTGSWFDPRYSGERIPRLVDVIELLSPRKTGACIDIEIKHNSRVGTTLEPALAALLRRYDIADQIIVSSFNPFALRHFQRIAPEFPTALIYANTPHLHRGLWNGRGRHICKPDLLKPDRSLVTAKTARRAGRARYPMLPWTANSIGEAQRLFNLGCVGVISDDPAPLVDLYATKRATSGPDPSVPDPSGP